MKGFSVILTIVLLVLANQLATRLRHAGLLPAAGPSPHGRDARYAALSWPTGADPADVGLLLRPTGDLPFLDSANRLQKRRSPDWLAERPGTTLEWSTHPSVVELRLL